MKYTVTVGQRAFTVDLTGNRIVLDGRELSAELHVVPGTPLRQLVLPDASTTFAMHRNEGGWTVLAGGLLLEAAVVDERTRILREMTGADGGPAGDRTVKAPMPGLVLRVEVEAGARVESGTPLLVLEAMKMENELRADGPGVVRAVHVQAGQAVERGVALVDIAAEEG